MLLVQSLLMRHKPTVFRLSVVGSGCDVEALTDCNALTGCCSLGVGWSTRVSATTLDDQRELVATVGSEATLYGAERSDGPHYEGERSETSHYGPSAARSCQRWDAALLGSLGCG